MSAAGPRLTIAKAAIPYVREAYFDSDAYASYLEQRNVPESEYGRLDIVVDENKMLWGSHGSYDAAEPNDPISRHIIAFSPYGLSNSVKRQGKTLRHETEHFIYQLRHPNHLRNRKILLGGAIAVGGVVSGYYGAKWGIDISHNLPLAAEIPIDTVTCLGSTAVGSATTLLESAFIAAMAGPSEIQAEWAERWRKSMLPDGVLQLEFA